MIITPEVLTKLAKDFVARRIRQTPDVAAVYLTGSILGTEPLLGGSTDIDLVFVHKEQPKAEREVVRISYEVSFDIQHHHQSFYTFHRRLRLNPWLGQALTTHQSILHDVDHWLEFIQAGVTSQYNAPETIYARTMAFTEKARSQWFKLDDPQEIPFSSWIDLYFKAVYTSANAIAVFSGPALTTRRLLLDFPARAEAINKLSLVGGLARLIGGEQASMTLYQDWRPFWESALADAAKSPACPPNLHPARKAYFLNACDAMAEGGSAHAAIWPAIETWRLASQTLNDSEHQERWLGFLSALGFTPDAKPRFIGLLDHLIEEAEHALKNWKTTYGL